MAVDYSGFAKAEDAQEAVQAQRAVNYGVGKPMTNHATRKNEIEAALDAARAEEAGD